MLLDFTDEAEGPSDSQSQHVFKLQTSDSPLAHTMHSNKIVCTCIFLQNLRGFFSRYLFQNILFICQPPNTFFFQVDGNHIVYTLFFSQMRLLLKLQCQHHIVTETPLLRKRLKFLNIVQSPFNLPTLQPPKQVQSAISEMLTIPICSRDGVGIL